MLHVRYSVCGPCILSVKCCSLNSTADSMSTPANSLSCFSPSCRLLLVSPLLGSASLLLCVLWHAWVFRSARPWVSLFLSDAFSSIKGSAGIEPNCSLVYLQSLDYFLSCVFNLSNGFQQLSRLRNISVKTGYLVIAHQEKLSYFFVEVWYLNQHQLQK